MAFWRGAVAAGVVLGLGGAGAGRVEAQRLPGAAVSVSGPSFRVTAQKLPSIANHLLQCVRGISVDMGFISSGRGNRAVWSA